MKKYLLVTLLFSGLIIHHALSQQLTPQVMATSGDFYNNSSGMLSFTVGEMAAVETYTSVSAILTQGFQQPWDFETSVTEIPGIDFALSIYPNPSDGIFYLLTESENDANVKAVVSDVLGRKFMEVKYVHESGTHNESLDLSGAVQGLYLVNITMDEIHSDLPTYSFIQKIQLVK